MTILPEIERLVFEKDLRHTSLRNGVVFVDVKLTDNGIDHGMPPVHYRLAIVGDFTVDNVPYKNLCISTDCDTQDEVLAKLRQGFFEEEELREAAALRNRLDYEREVIEKADKAKEATDGRAN